MGRVLPLACRYRTVLTIEGQRKDWLALLAAVSKCLPEGTEAAEGGLIDPRQRSRYFAGRTRVAHEH